MIFASVLRTSVLYSLKSKLWKFTIIEEGKDWSWLKFFIVKLELGNRSELRIRFF